MDQESMEFPVDGWQHRKCEYKGETHRWSFSLFYFKWRRGIIGNLVDREGVPSASPPHLSSLRHWKWIEERSSSTPVFSGSCLHSCMQWRSAASKSPDWYSRCASSANPWKESIRLVGSGAPTQPKEGGNNMLEMMEGKGKETNNKWEKKYMKWCW